jgi:hypothetical protein
VQVASGSRGLLEWGFAFRGPSNVSMNTAAELHTLSAARKKRHSDQDAQSSDGTGGSAAEDHDVRRKERSSRRWSFGASWNEWRYFTSRAIWRCTGLIL